MTVLVKNNVESFLEEAAQRVEEMTGPQVSTSHFEWANHHIRVVLVGVNDPRFFTDAIVHRQKAELNASPELTIYVVDDSIAGQVLPQPFWKDSDLDIYGHLQGITEDDFAEYSSFNQVFTILSRKTGLCFVWVRNVAELPEWERSFPFRSVLYQWFKNSQFLFVHAGAVGNQRGGVLLTGKGGMGKSTATLSCLNSDLKYAGDDFVMIDTETLVVYSLYNVAKLEASNLHRFPKLAPYVTNVQSLPLEKGQIFLHFCKPESLISEFKLKAIFLPRFNGREDTVLLPATKGEALLALAPSTIGLLKADAKMMSRIAGLIQKLPCYWIETGKQLDTIPATISNWLITDANG